MILLRTFNISPPFYFLSFPFRYDPNGFLDLWKVFIENLCSYFALIGFLQLLRQISNKR